VRRLLEPTSLPPGLVDELLSEVSAVWLMGETAAVVAGDLVLCHPALAADEVRAVAKPTTVPGSWRVTVAAHSRSGLTTGLAGVLAGQRLSISDGSATVLSGGRLFLQRVTAAHAEGMPTDGADWDAVGERLRAVLGRCQAVHPPFSPRPPVVVDAQPEDLGRVLVTLEAPDQVGLLWAAAAWFEQQGCRIEAYRATSVAATAHDTFVIVGDCDCAGLAAALGGAGGPEPWRLPPPARAGLRIAVSAAALGVSLAVRAGRAAVNVGRDLAEGQRQKSTQ
jgi:predicted amino acid-binding ACT domain protein